MDADLDTLATALYSTADDLLSSCPDRGPVRPRIGFAPQISDAEVLTLAVMQAMLGFTSEARWLRYVAAHLGEMFPYVPQQSGYNKRVRKLAATMAWLTAQLGRLSSIGDDDVWVVDSTPIECGRSRETARRSQLAGWAEYGDCASHSRFFWGLRLHLVCTLHGLPVGWVLTGAKTDEREAFWAIATSTPAITQILATGQVQTMIADRNYFGHTFETDVAAAGIDLLRPARRGEQPRAGARFFKPLRQVIESVNQTLKGQLDLERHGARSYPGVCARIAARILAMTTAIWHNDHIGSQIRRSLIAYDH